MEKPQNLNCAWASAGLALHNSGRCLLCCHSQTYLEDDHGQQLYLDANTVEQAWNSPTRQQIQQDLAAGIQHPNCSACWNEEAAGRLSRRQVANQQFADLEINPAKPQLVDLKPGITCNLACRTCWPEVSSKWYRDYWETDAHRWEPDYKKYLSSWGRIRTSYTNGNTRLWSDLDSWFSDVVYYDIYGAEPMLLDKVFDILRHSVETGQSRNQSLHVNTNGTIWNQEYIDILTQFKQVNIDISIDGIGPHFDYIRYGETWATVEQNLNRYQELAKNNANIAICICVTVCSLNVLYINQLEQYFVKRKLPMFFNMVHHPHHINVRALPDAVKAQVRQQVESELSQNRNVQHITSVLDFMDMPLENQPQSWQKFCETTKKLDLLREQDLASTFPEFWKSIEPYWLGS